VKLSQFLGFLAVSLTLAAAGCKSAGTIAANPQIRVMNASVEQPSLTFLLTTTTLSSGLAYPTATDYTQEAPGGYTVHVEPAGTTATLINQPVVFQPGTSYTFIAAEAAFASPSLAPIFLTDDNSAPSSGQMKLRVVNSSPDVGNLDVYVVSPGKNLQGVSPTISNLGFQSATSYQSLAPGNYEIYFTAVGQKTILIDSGALTFHAGQIRTVVAFDATGGYTSTTLADVN
jgi:uncharacterized protein DUF4397